MSDGQRNALSEHWDDYVIELTDDPLSVDDCFDNHQSLCIEIGFGMGDSLVEMAMLAPEKNFIGVEVHRPGIGHLLAETSKMNLANLKVIANDSVVVLDKLKGADVSCVQVFFPDPWPKKRHHKRRLINSGFLDLVVKCLKVGGIFHVATDWVPYGEEVLELLDGDSRFEGVEVPVRGVTKYERRGIRLGHRVMDIAVKLV
jgi:tRNA (guanine-N7-)-methyltransferase